jgi:hypothetical protein
MGPSSRTLGLDLSGKISLFLTLFSFPFLIPYLTSLLSSPTFAFSPVYIVQASQFPKSPLSTLFPFLYHPFPHSMYPFFFFFSFGKAHYWFVRTIIIIIIIFIFILSSYKIFKLRWPAHFSGILFFTILIKFK